MDRKALHVVRANARNLNGYSPVFELVTGHSLDKPTYDGAMVQVRAGGNVLVLDAGPSGAEGGAIYTVNPGSPMIAAENQPIVGDVVRVTSDGSLWMRRADGTFVDTSWAVEDRVVNRLGAQLSELASRVPLPPPPAPALPAEG